MKKKGKQKGKVSGGDDPLATIPPAAPVDVSLSNSMKQNTKV